MSYAVKEIFHTLQGEGFHTGRPAVFLRFAGCNLWTGLEKDRPTAVCQFCDTDFVGTDGEGGGKFQTPEALAEAVSSHWPAFSSAFARPYVVITGGEPMLQLDEPLIDALHREGFEIAVETNGTILPPPGIDWVCVSPKAKAQLVVTRGDELKLVYPQAGMHPAQYESLDFKHFLIQPMDGADRERNTGLAIRFCEGHPKWRLSLQTHKVLNIP
jgi:7-carboxy-7-deazaguanine synthase (Cx14CxxC type)